MEQIGIAGLIDIKTTGFSPSRDEIMELCFILFSFNRSTGHLIQVIDKYSSLREPSTPICRLAANIHGITREEARGAELDIDHIKSLVQRAEFIIAHNAALYCVFLANLLADAKKKPWLCSKNNVNWIEKGFSSKSLKSLLRAHDIQTARKQRATEDATAILHLLTTGRVENKSYLLELMSSEPVQIDTSHTDKSAINTHYENTTKDYYSSLPVDTEVHYADHEHSYKIGELTHSGFRIAFIVSGLIFALSKIYSASLSNISYSIVLLSYFGYIAFQKQKENGKWYILEIVAGFVVSAAALIIASLIFGFLINFIDT